MSLKTPNDDLGLNSDLPDSHAKSKDKSTINTMAPYEPSHRRRRTYKLDPTLVHFNHIFKTNYWSRYLVLKTEKKISSSVLENKLLSLCPTREMTFRAQKTNEWLIETTTKIQSETFLSIKEIHGIKTNVQSHELLNYVQGTVVLPQMEDETEMPEKNIILESLKLRYDNVHDIELYQVPSRKEKNSYLKIAKIKFTGQDLPLKIKILGQNREVRPHVPKPLQCQSCCKFGHTHKKCENNEICAVCGSEDHKTNWKCPTVKCCNCGLGHHAKSKECIFHIYNTELKLLMSRTGMPAKEAKLELKARGILDPGKNPTYKTVLKRSDLESPDTGLDNRSKEKTRPHIVRNNSIANDIRNPNRYEILTNLDKESEDNTLTENTEEAYPNVVPHKENPSVIPKPQRPYGNNKRNLERTPPRNKKLNIIDSHEAGPSGIITKPSNNSNESNRNNAIVVASEEIEEQSENMDLDKAAVNNDEYKIEDEITPSPIFTSKMNKLSSLNKEHTDNCGCHSCFIKTCCKIQSLTKDTLINTIRNFIRFKSKETTNLELHQTGCMCINHLIQYKEKHIHILDNFLESFNEAQVPKNTSKETRLN